MSIAVERHDDRTAVQDGSKSRNGALWTAEEKLNGQEPVFDEKEERRVLRKVDFMVMPILRCDLQAPIEQGAHRVLTHILTVYCTFCLFWTGVILAMPRSKDW